MPRRKTKNTALVQVWITPEERDALIRLADAHNTTTTDILRRQLRAVITANAPLLEKQAVGA